MGRRKEEFAAGLRFWGFLAAEIYDAATLANAVDVKRWVLEGDWIFGERDFLCPGKVLIS